MRSKLVYIAAALCMLLLCLALQGLEAKTGPMRVHQHRVSPAAQTASAEAEETGFRTHLPIVRLTTGGREIPGAPVLEDGKFAGYATAENGATAITAEFALIDSGSGANAPEDRPAVSSPATVRYRGNSSRFFDKKSYSIHLVTEQGLENPLALSGMAAHDEWVLNGPFLDRTLLRNYLCMNIAGEIMDYAPNVRYCELFLDGAYQGLYLLMESVSRGENRINIAKPGRNSSVTGYIVRFDRADKGDHELNNFTRYTFRAEVSALDVRYPGKTLINEARMHYIEQDLSHIEKVLYSSELSDSKTGAAKYLDYRAFAQYFVINEFFRNVDAGRFSTYYFKEARGKLKPCVWDFNNACDNYIDYIWDETGFSMQNAPWFGELLRDRHFVATVVETYRTLRKEVLSDAYLMQYMDETLAWLGDAPARNYGVWGWVFDLNHHNGMTYLTPAERNYESYDEAVQQLRDFLTARGAWLDAHIDALFQYCHPSKNTAGGDGA